MKKEFQQHVSTDEKGATKTTFDKQTKEEKEAMPPVAKSMLAFLGDAPEIVEEE